MTGERAALVALAALPLCAQRNGPIGDLQLAFIREYARFANMEQFAPEF